MRTWLSAKLASEEASQPSPIDENPVPFPACLRRNVRAGIGSVGRMPFPTPEQAREGARPRLETFKLTSPRVVQDLNSQICVTIGGTRSGVSAHALDCSLFADTLPPARACFIQARRSRSKSPGRPPRSRSCSTASMTGSLRRRRCSATPLCPWSRYDSAAHDSPALASALTPLPATRRR